MCGIFAYVGSQNAVEISLAGLRKLEYRGYDSSGIAGLRDGKLSFCKEVGKVSVMEEKAREENLELDLAIAHTRWATHGKPSRLNAHPHFDSKHTMALVHNGIIENYDIIRQGLKEKGVSFQTETDTETMVELISSLYEGDLLKAVQQALPHLKGALSIALIHKDHPGKLVVAARESPLAIGIGNGECFVASDTNAFLVHTREVVYLTDGEVAEVTAEGFEVFDATMAQVMKERELLANEAGETSKGNFEHYMLKEMFEQPQTIRNALLSRYLEEDGNVTFDGLDVKDLKGVERILILACGSSWHAGFVASYLLEAMARIPTQVEISSEFRYMNPIVADNTLVLAISQSGETADTVAALRELKARGAKIVGICNVQGSTLAREADSCLFLRAGAEIGVASTKAFTSQLVVLSLFSLMMARMRDMSLAEGKRFIDDLQNLSEQVREILSKSEEIRAIAQKYAGYKNFFFVGRNLMYPVGLEGALKLKELAYVNANGYPAGELKHGPIALIDENCPTIGLCANRLTLEKTISNLMEVRARSGLVLAIASEGSKGLETVADDLIWIPKTRDELSPILTTVALQLFAYFVAYENHCEIDQPRNLAKSVTVE